MTTAAQLSENSHQGFDGLKAALCLESMKAKSNTASGMPVCLWRNGIGSRSTGKERDAETGLDYFGARYLSAAQGRWTSPDPTLLSVNAFNPQSWNRYSYVMNNPLLYVDPLGLWEIYAEDLYKWKKKKDGTEERVFDKRVVYARKTEKDDDGASLAKQLGMTGKDATKFAEKIGSGDNVRLADQGGLVGNVFGAVESRLTEQAKFELKNPGTVGGPYGADCSLTAAQIGLGYMGTVMGPNNLDPMLSSEASMVSANSSLVGDIIRYAKSDNVATHFANFIFRNDDGTPVAFSKNGNQGPFSVQPAQSLQNQTYGNITGYYRKR
jgi:RHS repeat-associated protein